MLSKLYVFAGVAVVAFGAGAYTAHQFSKADKVKQLEAALKIQKANYDARDAAFVEQQNRDASLSLKNSILARELDTANDALSHAIKNPKIKFIIREVPTDAQPCPDNRRGAAYRVCLNAAASGDTTVIAACAAGGVDAGVPGEPVSTHF